MGLSGILITILITVFGGWFVLKYRPKHVIAFCKKCAAAVYYALKTPAFCISFLVVVLVTAAYLMVFRDLISPEDKLVVAIANFYQMSGTEREENNRLLNRLSLELKKHREEINLIDTLCATNDSSEAREMGKKMGAHVVIWGMIEKTRVEAEIEPHIAICRPFKQVQLKARELSTESRVSIGELEKIDFAKRKAAEIADVVMFILGFAKYKLEDYKSALKIFQERIAEKDADVWFGIGNCCYYLYRPKYEKALAAYCKAIELDSACAKAYCNIGNIFLESKKFTEAMEKFKEGIEADSNFSNAYCSWGVALEKTGLLDQAIEKYEKAIQIDSTNAEAYNNWGVVLGKLDSLDAAVEKYKKAIQVDPKNVIAYFNLGNTLLRRTIKKLRTLSQITLAHIATGV